ncbi:MAG: glycosyltransferase family 39 protein [Chitinophagaceae bacterium]
MKKTTNQWVLIIALAVIKFILPFLLQNAAYEPHRDEFLYLAEGQHLAWGFMEVPPLLSVFAWLVHAFGDGMFWIKCWPSLFGALTFIIVARTIVSLGGKTFAIILGFLPFVTGVYLRLHFLFQPNFLEVFFWTMIAYSMVNYVQTKENKWLYIFGIGVGLGMMSKYSVAFFVVAILAGLLLTKQRTVFSNKHFYLASLLALLIFLPNLLWQYNHHFPVVFHMKELKKTQLQYVSPLSFILDQFLMNIPCVFIWIAGLWYTGFSKQNSQYRFIALGYVTVIVLLLLGHGKNYYALGAYPILFAFGAYHLEKVTAIRMRAWRYVFIIFALALGYVFLPIALPLFEPAKLAAFYEKKHTARTGALKWEDLKNHPLPQDFADMLSWQEMSKKMATAYHALDSNEKKHTLVFCDNYGQAGAVNYYRHQYNMPEAYSVNASFLYWMPEPIEFDNIVLLTDDANEMQHDFIKNFKSATLSDSVTSPLAVEKGDLIIILKGANDKFKQFFREKIASEKAKARWQ